MFRKGPTNLGGTNDEGDSTETPGAVGGMDRGGWMGEHHLPEVTHKLEILLTSEEPVLGQAVTGPRSGWEPVRYPRDGLSTRSFSDMWVVSGHRVQTWFTSEWEEEPNRELQAYQLLECVPVCRFLPRLLRHDGGYRYPRHILPVRVQ